MLMMMMMLEWPGGGSAPRTPLWRLQRDFQVDAKMLPKCIFDYDFWTLFQDFWIFVHDIVTCLHDFWTFVHDFRRFVSWFLVIFVHEFRTFVNAFRTFVFMIFGHLFILNRIFEDCQALDDCLWCMVSCWCLMMIFDALWCFFEWFTNFCEWLWFVYDDVLFFA